MKSVERLLHHGGDTHFSVRAVLLVAGRSQITIVWKAGIVKLFITTLSVSDNCLILSWVANWSLMSVFLLIDNPFAETAQIEVRPVAREKDIFVNTSTIITRVRIWLNPAGSWTAVLSRSLLGVVKRSRLRRSEGSWIYGIKGSAIVGQRLTGCFHVLRLICTSVESTCLNILHCCCRNDSVGRRASTVEWLSENRPDIVICDRAVGGSIIIWYAPVRLLYKLSG